MLKWLFKPKKKAVEPDLRTAFEMLKKLTESLDNTAFYISLIKDFELSEECIIYLTRAEFNLSSLRDEIQIMSRNKDMREAYERYTKRQ